VFENNQKINVLQLLSSLQIGGLEKLLVEMMKSNKQNSKNVNFTIVIMNDEVNEMLKKELLATDYNIYFLNRKEGHKHPKYLLQLLKIIIKHKINIIHSHNYGSKMWSILCKVLTKKIKLVYTIHDSVIVEKMSKINLFIHRMFIDKSIAISEVIYQDCFKKNINKSIKIYNGVDTKKFIPNEEKSANNEVFNIINIARITHYKKGQDILIKALKECKNNGMEFSCSFVGGIYEYDIESFEYLKDLINRLELSEKISFLGNRDDIPELLLMADLFVLPSRYEGLPISLLEAMAAKTPVIASNISGSNDVIKSGENGSLFESENYIDLADKIMFLYNNREKMRELAENAYKYVQDFDISVMCEKYNKIYSELIGDGQNEYST